MSVTQSYKSQDTEETLDKLFYRPIGYQVALAAKALRITPNGVTYICIVSGIIAAVLFYYQNLHLTITAIVLLVFSETLDSADGQLARLTSNYSKTGRILDGLATTIVYFAIYIMFLWMFHTSANFLLIFVIVACSANSHGMQTMISDFYRNCYLEFSNNEHKGELRSSSAIMEDIKACNSTYDKLLLYIYYIYTLNQNNWTKSYQNLKLLIIEKYQGNIPKEFSEKYRQLNKKNIKYYNIITANTRMIVLIIAMLISQPFIYFGFEIIVLNSLMFYIMIKQRLIAKELIKFI